MRTIGIILILVCASLARAQETLTIGSKSFTESVLLGEILAERARRQGLKVESKAALLGTRLAFEAVRSGAIDVYPDYTGTLAGEIFADRGISSEEDIRQALQELGLEMSEPIGFNNTYAIGVMPETAQRLGLSTISDLREHPELVFGFTNEFIDRNDGWRGLRSAYGLPQENIKGIAHELGYNALGSGAIDAKELYSTDARIESMGLVVLEDDLGYFARYDAVWVYRRDLSPEAKAAIESLTGILNESSMAQLNAMVEADGREEADVARDYVDGIAQRGNVLTLHQRIAQALANMPRHTLEHAVLVGVSMLGAIAFAVPMGVLAARSRTFEQVVLGVSGILQTIPSLALLALLVSVLAMANQIPAIVALFVYSLLPIVRNTHAGLVQLPQAVRDSAGSLGLPWGRMLLDVELPLALPSILAGIKTAVVINVGTATLGGFVAAGGYGVPILAGIRRDDEVQILAGLVPAALMAIVLTLLVDSLERVLSPAGIRGVSR